MQPLIAPSPTPHSPNSEVPITEFTKKSELPASGVTYGKMFPPPSGGLCAPNGITEASAGIYRGHTSKAANEQSKNVNGVPEETVMIGASVQPPSTFCLNQFSSPLNHGVSHVPLMTQRWRVSKSASPRSRPGLNGSR